MTSKSTLHKTLAGFARTVTKLLPFAYWEMEKPENQRALELALGATFWRRITKASKAKNDKAWPYVFELFSVPGIRQGVSRAAKDLSFRPPVIGSALEGAEPFVRRYYEERALDFVTQMGQTDKLRLKSLIWQNMGENERSFSRMMRGSYICDGDESRIEMIKRTESHTASTGGAFNYASDAGAKFKTWVTAGDDRVRESHQDLEGETIAVDQPFPNGRYLPDEPGCRCHLTFSFEEMPGTITEEENEEE